jgi:hypothetical protein
MDCKIITLGCCCRISNTLETLKIKQINSFCEYTKTDYFSDILIIIKMILEKQNVEITTRKEFKDLFLEDTNIRTTHYPNFKEIFDRRSQRFLDDIIDNKPILFIREDFENIYTTYDYIKEFYDLIYKYNPSCNFKFLLFSSGDIFSFKNFYQYKLPDNNETYLQIIKSIEI